MPKNLLEDDDSTAVAFNINKSYADNYDTWRRKEELQKYKDRYGKDALDGSEEGSSSSSSSDEETDVEENEAFDKEFYHTLSCLKAKDPKIYDKETKFFENADKKAAENDEKKSNKKSKPMYLRDYERKLILEKGGVLSDEDEVLDNDGENGQVHSPSYFEEQEAIKKSFKNALADNKFEEENEGNSIGGLFSRKTKSSEEEAKEADEYAAWLQGRKDELENEEEAKQLSYLRSYWTDPSLDEGEAFLRDYILQKKFTYKGKEKKTKKETSPVESDNGEFELEEQEIQKMEDFEHKYNFRFEEPDQEFIKRYPRTLDSTLRKQDDRRKEKRQDLKTRKELEIEKKKEELRKAKEFKRKEIEEKLKQLCTITGNPEIGFKDEDLEEDFDPEEHDRRMRQLFSQDDFYAEPEDQKPEFPEFDEELGIEDWDNWAETGEENNANEADTQDTNLEDPNFNMDCDYDPSANAEKALKGRKAKRERGRRRRGTSSKLAEGLAKEKPVFDPIAYLSKNPKAKQSEAFEKYVDEYYGLDFEDVIGGDLPCRFKYRKVVPNDYGLTVEEILAADDKELNRWCSLKKALRIKPVENEKYDVQAYRKKGSNFRLKQKVFPSLFANPQDEEVASTSKKKNKKMAGDNSKNKKLNKDNSSWNVSDIEVMSEQEKHESNETSLEGENAESSAQETNADAGKKKRKRMDSAEEVEENQESSAVKKKKSKKTSKEPKKSKEQKPSTSNDYFSNITKSRLKAYGINPKKFRNKLKYKKPQ